MTCLKAIDEAGDLGKSGSRYFVMAAVMNIRARNLLNVSKAIPARRPEVKFYNASEDARREALSKLSDTCASIVYVAVDKHAPGRTSYGNELYEDTIARLMEASFKALPCKDVNVVVDGSRFITVTRLREVANASAIGTGANIKKCDKGHSESNGCLRIADFVAGAIWTCYEKSDDRFIDIIRKNIRRP
ncbi:MAG: DUF3800 domain-containing protein [Candidatus Methanoplasma sp.]|jgi:hypothetical protein|nr:DUF3800 domain-containing protein [Candidatus Methanoplasma sp.]